MKYKFTIKGSEDAIGYVKADTKYEAQILSSKTKQLKLKDFLKIFEVKKA